MSSLSDTVASLAATMTSDLAQATATAAAEAAQSYDLYGFVPSKQANLAGLILFAILWAYHTVAGIYYKQWWFFVSWFIGCGLETAGYIGRFESHSDMESVDDFLVQIICLTLGPAFLMGGVYYQLAKCSMIYSADLSPLKPMHYSAIFISFDLVSIILQAIGGGMAATALKANENTDPGTHIMVAGISFQVLSMLIFIVMCCSFGWRIYQVAKTADNGKINLVDNSKFNPDYVQLRSIKMFRVYFPLALTWCTLGIFIRCIYRVAELSQGWSGYLITHEPYFLVLDGLMVFLGALGLSVIHPGFALGRDVIPVKGLHFHKEQDKSSSIVSKEQEQQATSSDV